MVEKVGTIHHFTKHFFFNGLLSWEPFYKFDLDISWTMLLIPIMQEEILKRHYLT